MTVARFSNCSDGGQYTGGRVNAITKSRTDALLVCPLSHHRVSLRRGRKSIPKLIAPRRIPGSGTTVPSAGAGGSVFPKFCERIVKSFVSIAPSRLKSPLPYVGSVVPKLLARLLKSSALTLPSNVASPGSIWIVRMLSTYIVSDESPDLLTKNSQSAGV